MVMMQHVTRAVRRLVAIVALLSAAAGASACAKARAEVAPDGPPLQMPAPPQRVVVPVEIPITAEAPPDPEPPPVAEVPTPAPKPAARRPAAPPAAQPAPAPPAVADTRELRTASPTAAATERSVRDMLVRAQRDLGRVDYARLSGDGRAQYEQSKRFSSQAEEALKARNLVFASTLADKAATLAAELANR